MRRAPGNLAILTFLAVGGMALCGCTESQERISPDFGDAIQHDITAQIAHPDAHYAGDPGPGYDGQRASLAQTRYQKDQVVPPSSVTASSPGSVGTADNGGQTATPGASVAGTPAP